MRKVTDGIDFRGPVGDGSGFNGSINSNCISDLLSRALHHFQNLQPNTKPEFWDLGHGDGLLLLIASESANFCVCRGIEILVNKDNVLKIFA